jgi:hypothetical protein
MIFMPGFYRTQNVSLVADTASSTAYTRAVQARITIEASTGLERRAHALSEYLSELHANLETNLERDLEPVKLCVLSERDWGQQVQYPYGFTFYRRLRDGSGVIFAPGNYPGNLTWVFKSVMVRAEQAGVRVPGTLEEFFDLTLGHELGHAIADQLLLRTRVRWLDEFLATYLYVGALEQTQPEALARVIQWGQVLEHAEFDPDEVRDEILNNLEPDESNPTEFDSLNLESRERPANPEAIAREQLIRPAGNRKRKTKKRLERSLENTIKRHDLGAFEFPFQRLPLANQAWYQARFTLRATDLLRTRGLEFMRSASEILPTAKGRGGVHRAMIQLEPSFKPWFASFGRAH